MEKTAIANLSYLFLTGLLFWIGITLLLPTLPAYIQDVGGTPQQVGLVMGCFAIGLLCSRTWLGNVADSRSRKLVMLIGTFVAGTAPFGYLLVTSIAGLASIRAFHGISIAAFTIGYSALVVDYAPRAMRGKVIGYMNMSVPLGMSIGPALGGYLQVDFGYRVLFIVSALTGIVALILTSRVKEIFDRQLINEEDLKTSERNFWQLSSDRALSIPTIILLTIGLVFGTLVAFLPLYVRELALPLNVGLFYTTIAIASFSVRLFVGQASDRYGRGLFISASLICYLISMLLLSQAETPQDFLWAAVAEGSGAGILIPLILALISDRSYSNERGRVFALCLGGFDVGIALAGPILGALESYIGYRHIFAIAAGLSAIALIIFLTQSGKSISHSLRFALGKEQDTYAIE
jgi:MFS family permease